MHIDIFFDDGSVFLWGNASEYYEPTPRESQISYFTREYEDNRNSIRTQDKLRLQLVYDLILFINCDMELILTLSSYFFAG